MKKIELYNLPIETLLKASKILEQSGKVQVNSYFLRKSVNISHSRLLKLNLVSLVSNFCNKAKSIFNDKHRA